MTQQMNILEYQPETQEEPAKVTQPDQEIIDADPVPAQTESSSKEIAVIDTSPKNALTIFSNNGLDPLIAQIRARVKSEQFDVTTQKGRDRIGSVARQIGSAKQDLIKMAASLTEDAKKQIAAVNTEKNRMETEFDKLRDEVLAPRKAYEQIEKDRQAEHEKNLTILEGMIEFAYPEQYTVEQIENALAKSSELYTGRQWQEYADRANYANLKNKDKLTQAIAKRKEIDEAAAEVERQKEADRQAEIQRAADKAADDARIAAETAANEAAAALAKQVEADKQAENAKRIKLIEDNIRLMGLPNGLETFTSARTKDYLDMHNKFYGEKKGTFEEFTEQAEATYNDTLAKLNLRFNQALAEELAERNKQNNIRIEMIKARIQRMSINDDVSDIGSETIKKTKEIMERDFNADQDFFEEFKDEAKAMYDDAVRKLDSRLKTAEANEAERKRINDAAIAKAATDAENKRIKDAKDAEETARKAREADEANKQRIVDEISFDLMLIQTAPPITKEEAEAVARALIDGKVRNVIVKY